MSGLLSVDNFRNNCAASLFISTTPEEPSSFTLTSFTGVVTASPGTSFALAFCSAAPGFTFALVCFARARDGFARGFVAARVLLLLLSAVMFCSSFASFVLLATVCSCSHVTPCVTSLSFALDSTISLPSSVFSVTGLVFLFLGGARRWYLRFGFAAAAGAVIGAAAGFVGVTS